MHIEYKNILLIQLRQLGDILLTTPAIRAVRAQFPDAHITFLSHSMGKLILNGNPNIDTHLILPSEQSSLREKLSFYTRLNSNKYDLVIDFMGNPRSALLTWLTRAKTRASFSSTRNLAYNVVSKRVSGSDYIVFEKYRIIKFLGIDSSDVRLTLPWGEKEFQAVEGFFKNFETSSKRVCISPTHRRANRKWSSEQWLELAEWLVDSCSCEVFWLWGPGEFEEVVELQQKCKAKTHMAPKTTFRELAAFIAQTDLFIGNSNGPSHVAVAVNTPSLQLHGHTDAPSWSPVTPRHKVIQGNGAMDMSVDEVKKQVLELLQVSGPEKLGRIKIKSSDDAWVLRPVL